MTRRTRAGARVRALLTDLEIAVMRVVCDSEPCSVEAVYEVVSRDRDLKETTVRTLLRRLEQKGYLRHESEGRAYLYRSTEQPRSLAARAVRQIIDRFCQGSIEELVSGMVDAKMLSKAEIETSALPHIQQTGTAVGNVQAQTARVTGQPSVFQEASVPQGPLAVKGKQGNEHSYGWLEQLGDLALVIQRAKDLGFDGDTYVLQQMERWRQARNLPPGRANK